MLSGNFDEATKGYYHLINDYQSSVVPMNEVSAREMYTIFSLRFYGLRGDVFKYLEQAAGMFIKAGRPELAVRMALRMADYCHWSNALPLGNNSAVLVRIANAMCAAPLAAAAVPMLLMTPNPFLDATADVLHARVSCIFLQMRKCQRAALNAFLSVARFSKLGMHAPAAIVFRLAQKDAF